MTHTKETSELDQDLSIAIERIEHVEKALENYREYKTGIEDLETDVMYIKQRLEALEAANKMKSEMIGAVDTAYDEACRQMEKRIDELEKKVKEVDRFQDITHQQYQRVIKKQQPHKCPICDGLGKKYIDPNAPLGGFEAMFAPKDSEGRSYHPCNPCETKGIVWG